VFDLILSRPAQPIAPARQSDTDGARNADNPTAPFALLIKTAMAASLIEP
jgi:hypothetical protein